MKQHFTNWPVVEGFTDRQSYRAGDIVEVRCSSRAAGFSAEVARIGNDRVVVWRGEGIRGAEHPVTDDAYAVGCDWPVVFSFAVDPAWPSGFYEIALLADGATGERAHSEALFVVRPEPSAAAPAILVLATNTYNAYNQWGGACLYSGAVKVSFARPIERGYIRRPAAPDETAYDGRVASIEPEGEVEHVRFQRYLADNDYPLWCASGGWHSWERRFVQWAERQGIALDYAVGSDLEVHPGVLDGHRLMLSVGHDEYWSWGMRDRADAFVESGGSWAILSGNTCFWQVRYEDDGRTMVCYKGQYARGPGPRHRPRPPPVDHVVPAGDRPSRVPDDGAQLHPRRLRAGRAGHAPGVRGLHGAPAGAPAVRGHGPALRRRARRGRRDRRLRGRRL